MTEIKKIAHSLDTKLRTRDVILEESISFESLLLPETIMKGLLVSGFQKPSPIQVKALPVGRCGFDLMVKSKSGTGKTLVFGLIALETVKTDRCVPQVLIVAPTREIAVQIEDVIKTVGKYIDALKVECFIGGLSLDADKVKSQLCHIAVGTPGRLKQLIQEDYLNVNSVRLFVLDEADKLMENSFKVDVNEIFNSLSEKKQVIMCSATYPNELEIFLKDYMLSPTLISIELDTPLLLGLKQFAVIVKSSPNVVQQTKAKNEELLKLLSTVSFTQCLIFSNYQTRAESISNFLNRNGWTSTFISAAQDQMERLSSISSLKNQKCRILISTDLTSRGIDAANVNLVINYDIPIDAMTYLHRMGRAGRYGSAGNCINLTLVGQESRHLQGILGIIGGQNLSIPILNDDYKLENHEICKENLLFGIVPENIKELSVKCKNQIMEMKNQTSKKVKKGGKNTNKLLKEPESQLLDVPQISGHFPISTESNKGTHNNDEDIRKIIQQNLSNVDVSTVLGDLASGTFKVDDLNAKTLSIDVAEAYNILLPSPPKQELETDMGRNSGKSDKLQSVLEKLAKDGMPSAISTEELNENIRRKPENTAISGIKNKSDFSSSEELFCKNKALFSVAKSISNVEFCNEDEDNITRYLDMIKTKENLEALSISEINDTSLKEEDSQKVNKKPYGEILENLFLLAYRSQVVDTADKWEELLSDEDKKKLENNFTIPNEISMKDLEEEGDSYCNEEDDEYEYDEDYDFELEKEVTVNYDKEIVKNDSPEDANDNFMMWIPVESEVNKTNEAQQNTFQNETCTISPSDIGYKNFNNKIELFPQHNGLKRESDTTPYLQQYSQYYQQCSYTLWQTGLGFDTVQNFDEWFCFDWQNQMASVRNFVQQRIYIEEMNKYYADKSKKQ